MDSHSGIRQGDQANLGRSFRLESLRKAAGNSRHRRTLQGLPEPSRLCAERHRHARPYQPSARHDHPRRECARNRGMVRRSAAPKRAQAYRAAALPKPSRRFARPADDHHRRPGDAGHGLMSFTHVNLPGRRTRRRAEISMTSALSHRWSAAAGSGTSSRARSQPGSRPPRR